MDQNYSHRGVVSKFPDFGAKAIKFESPQKHIRQKNQMEFKALPYFSKNSVSKSSV